MTGGASLRRALAPMRTVLRRADRRAEKIVSHHYRFVWICNPKAASRSLIAALLDADPQALLVRGQTLEQVYAAHPEARAYRRVAFLRHPVDRTRSFFADKHALALSDADARRWFIDPWHGVEAGMDFAAFCRWLETPWGSDAFADRHWLSQWRQLADRYGRLPDFLGRYETLEADWRRVCEALGLPRAPLPRINVSGAAREAIEVDAASAARLMRRYARDVALGGYGAAP